MRQGRRSKIKKPTEEQLSDEQLARIEEEHLWTEGEVIQQEIFARMPGWITFLRKYEFKPLLKILGTIGIIIAVWYFAGWEAVSAGVASLLLMFAICYILQVKSQDRDSTIFVEAKLPGQKIEIGDNTPPYDHDFVVMEPRFAIWEVPNVLIRNGLFRIPGEQQRTFLPGTGNLIFTDLFDRINRTCVLPSDMDVANIALYTNANPMIAEKLSRNAEQISLDAETERLIKGLYSTGQMSEKDAFALLRPIKLRNKAFMSPNHKTRRDIFFELQTIIPAMRERINTLQNKTFLLADVLATRWFYKTYNVNMPSEIKEGHGTVSKLLGIPPYVE